MEAKPTFLYGNRCYTLSFTLHLKIDLDVNLVTGQLFFIDNKNQNICFTKLYQSSKIGKIDSNLNQAVSNGLRGTASWQLLKWKEFYNWNFPIETKLIYHNLQA